VDVDGVKLRSQDSSTMCCGVGSMRRREESGARWTRTWFEDISGMESRTWSSKGGGGGAEDEIVR